MKTYTLNGPTTYMTLSKRFQKGVQYTAADLGMLVEAMNPDGSPLFMPDTGVITPVEAQIEVGLVEETPPEVVVANVDEGLDDVVVAERAPRKLIVGKKK